MSSAVGFRAFPDGFSYVILEGTQENPRVLASERLTFPEGQEAGPALCWVRKQVEELLQAHSFGDACLKAIEPLARKKSAERIRVEAVILETLYTVASIDCAIRIKSQLKRDIRGFNEPARYLARVLSNSTDLERLHTPMFEEACIAAVSALPPGA